MSKKIGIVIGVLFTAFVVGLLIYLHTKKAEVPPVVENPPVVQEKVAKKVWVCDGAPKWVSEQLPKAIKFWGDLGCKLEMAGIGPCPNTCAFMDGTTPTQVACVPGAIAIIQRDIWASPESAGDTILMETKDIVIRLPEKLEMVDPTAVGSIEAPMPNPELPELVLAHELGHALNFGHSVTPIVGDVMAHKTGEIMNPSVTGLGWGTEGIKCE